MQVSMLCPKDFYFPLVLIGAILALEPEMNSKHQVHYSSLNIGPQADQMATKALEAPLL